MALGPRRPRCPCPCPPSAAPTAPEEAPAAKPGETPPEAEAPAPSPSDLAGTFGAAAGPQSVAPYMIGDFFGGSSSRSTVPRIFGFAYRDLPFRAELVPGGSFSSRMFVFGPNGDVAYAGIIPDPVIPPRTAPILAANDAAGGPAGVGFQGTNPDVPAGGTLVDGTIQQTVDAQLGSLYDATFRMQYQYVVDVASPGAGGGVGRLKVADNTSPMPRDRLIFDYSYFDDVPLWPGGVHVSRYTLGFEKTFFDGLTSFELKAPMATTLNSTVTLDGATGLDHGEFGNLALTVKGLFLRRETWAFSSGLQIGAPTGDDTRVVLADGTPLVLVRNDAVHVSPFMALLWTPNDRLFAQGFLQYDIDPNGNAVFVNSRGTGLASAGRLNDPNYLFLDLGIGYWTARSNRPSDCVTGLAWTAEMHWNRSVQDPDTVVAGNFAVGDFAGGIEVLDLTLGAHVELYRNTLVTLAYAFPIGSGQDQQFDGEFRVMLNHHFGRSNRANRAPLSL